MASARKSSSAWFEWAKRHKAWLLLGLTILFVVVVRVRLREMPLERDEGEYAYAGQLILQGVPPYKEVYNMKLPGTYVAYAAIMAVLGQTPSGIHLGVMVVNVASILLMFFIGRRLLDEVAGIVTAVSYALLSLSPSVLGVSGHATHFVVLPALGGILILLKATQPKKLGARNSSSVRSGAMQRSGDQAPGDLPSTLHPQSSTTAAPLTPTLSPLVPHGAREKSLAARAAHGCLAQLSTLNSQLFISGLLFGTAFLMKQHGLFFGLFGGLYLIWVRFYAWLQLREEMARESWRFQGASAVTQPSTLNPRQFVIYALGCVLPYLITCLWLWWAGVFGNFLFWTVSYARQYAMEVHSAYDGAMFQDALGAVTGPNLGFWILAGVGALMMWWDRRVGPNQRFLVVALFFCSIASVSVGYYFRAHYFILLLPVLALLCGVAVSRAVHLTRRARNAEIALGVPVLLVFSVGAGWTVLGNSSAWLSLLPTQVIPLTYGDDLFCQAAKAGEYLRTNCPAGARVAVLGSEPEILFYARHHSATGYIYMYPLMETHPYALKMQEEMIAELDRGQPEFVAFVNHELSWLPQARSEKKIQDWWTAEWTSHFDMVLELPVEPYSEARPLPGIDTAPETKASTSNKQIIIAKRRKQG